MTQIVARHGQRTLTVPSLEGATISATLSPTPLGVRTGCNGNGSCGLCRVRILAGAVSSPTAEEEFHLTPQMLASGVRLACQTIALGDMVLEIEALAPRAEWSPIPPEDLAQTQLRVGNPALGLRAALDVGTTNLNLTLWRNGEPRLAAVRGPNPQARFGSDIITRLQASYDPEVARQLAEEVEQAVAGALENLLGAEASSDAPCHLLAVGNSAMLSLLRGSATGLLAPEAWDGEAIWPDIEPLRWDRFGPHGALVTLVPPLGGFVGSDLLAGILAADLTAGDAPALLVDFGTNTEIAIWDGSTLWVTSAAGGPAFEACGLASGIPAEAGAISRVRPGEPFGFEVLGDGVPKGVCATGLVDWIACLAMAGRLTRRGNFQPLGSEPSLGGPGSGIVLAKRDVDLFQRAKAGIGAGVSVLLRQAGVRASDLGRIVTTGLFGRGLDTANAQALGLLPTVPVEQVEAYANLALAGCEAMLNGAVGHEEVEKLRARIRMVNLARRPEFDELFLHALFLEPMETL
jgi:uncharacterized 2Fe-2S/4Fe-4S cluster protein (DUF4445 family)